MLRHAALEIMTCGTKVISWRDNVNGIRTDRARSYLYAKYAAASEKGTF